MGEYHEILYTRNVYPCIFESKGNKVSPGALWPRHLRP